MLQEQFVLGEFLRRSSTTKNKPFVCDYPICYRLYFYLRALRRHEKQKHNDDDVTAVSVHREDDIEGIGAREKENEQAEPPGGTDSDTPTHQEQN